MSIMDNALNQYLELYEQQRELLSQRSDASIERLREGAYRRLVAGRLPERGDEGYEKTSINDIFAPDYGINLHGVKMPVDIAATFRCDVPNLSTLLGIISNDTFVPTNTLLHNLPEGVTVVPFSAASISEREVIDRYLGQVSDNNSVTDLNTLLATDGLLVHISRGVDMTKPLQLVSILSSDEAYMAVRRLLIVADKDSRADIILCDHTQTSDADVLSSRVIEMILDDGADISLVDMEESGIKTRRVNQLFVTQKSGSRLNVTVATLLSGVTRNEFVVKIDGERCETALNGMAIGSGTQHIDNYSEIIHRSGHSHSTQNFRYVLDEQSTGAFEGGIEVCPGAKMTEAYQKNGNILASRDARMHTKPRLLIYNDDVKCSHGASTGQLDENALFYMETRGVPRSQARTMLMEAFVAEAIAGARPEAVADRLHHLVEKRFAGTLATCHDCQGRCDKNFTETAE